MRAVWCWIGTEEMLTYARLRTLQLSAWSYRKLWPEDHLMCYGNSEIIQKLGSVFDGFDPNLLWNETVDLGSLSTFEIPHFHDWSRPVIMTLQDEPYLYVDADVILTDDNVKESVNKVRKALQEECEGIFPISYQTGESKLPDWEASKRDQPVRELLGKLKYSYQNIREPNGLQATPVLFGAFPKDSYILGKEIENLMKIASRAFEFEQITGRIREWVAGGFYRLVASRFNVDVDFRGCVNAFHVGGGGEEPWLLGSEGNEKKLARIAWVECCEELFKAYQDPSLVFTFESLYQMFNRKYKKLMQSNLV